MSEVDPIAAGLAVIQRLADADAFRGSRLSSHEALEAVLALAEQLPHDSAYARRCRVRLEGLLDALVSAGDESMAELPPAVIAAARRCRMPLPVESSSRGHAPARAGAGVERLDGLARSLVGEVGTGAAFVIDRHGQLVVAAGEADGIQCTLLARDASRVAFDELRRTGEMTIVIDEGQLYAGLLANRLLLVVIGARGAWLPRVRERARTAPRELARVFEAFPELREEDWNQLFGC